MRPIIPNLYISEDENEIVDLLVDYGLMPQSFSKDQTFAFERIKDFALILFFSSKDDRGFQLFVVEDFRKNKETMYQLAASLEVFIKEGFNPKIINQAKEEIRKYLKL